MCSPTLVFRSRKAATRNWPPLRANDKPTIGGGANASLAATTARSDGKPQATYGGHPLYLYQGDQKPGDTQGASPQARAAAMATSALARPPWTTANLHTVASILYAPGGVLLVGEAAVHVQQYASLFYGVRWIGPLFLANAAALAVAIAGLAYPRTLPLAALSGVVISALSLGSRRSAP